MTAKDWLFVALGLVALVYLAVFILGIRAASHKRAIAHGVNPDGGVAPSPLMLIICFVTNFFDTLGIGSFATTTAAYKLKRVIPVRLIPGTLNVGHTIPTIAQAFIYTKIVPVDSFTLIAMIAASCLGSWLGAGVVARWPRRTVQMAMGLALLGAAALLAVKVLNILPGGGQTLDLTGGRLVAGLVGNFVLGMLMMIGIGLYAPCMILIALLGMNPAAAFPIMMGSCAFLMPTSSVRFVRSEAFHVRAALGLAIGGLPAVLIAAYLVKSLPLAAVYWLVIVVVVYTAVNMLMTARHEDEPPVATPHA